MTEAYVKHTETVVQGSCIFHSLTEQNSPRSLAVTLLGKAKGHLAPTARIPSRASPRTRVKRQR